MKRLFFIIITLFTIFNLNGQSYDKNVKMVDNDKYVVDLPHNNKISIVSYVTRQNILTYANDKYVKKTVSELPKYRYELILVSKSIYNSNEVSTWIYNAKVFINEIEATREQFPDGFTALIKCEPTQIYWYESIDENISIRITWKNSIYNTNSE